MGSVVQAAEVYKEPFAGGPRLFEVTGATGPVNMREDQSTASAIVGKLAPGARLTNLGCAEVAGRVWCDVQPFAGGPRGFVSAEFLKPATGPDGVVAMGEDDSAVRLGEGQFDAEGNVPCAIAKGQPTIQCAFRVARGTGGYAAMDVTQPGGAKRTIFFADGVAISFLSAEADGSSDLPFAATKEGDLNIVRIGDERYEIPDAAILGG